MRACLAVLLWCGASWGVAGWGYRELDRWGDTYPMCNHGFQSPVNISTTEALLQTQTAADLVRFHYGVWKNVRIENCGRSVRLQPPEDAAASDVLFRGRRFTLREVHFHSPAEHLVDGRPAPIAMHCVHMDLTDDAAPPLVVGVLFEEGAANAELTHLWPAIPMAPSAEPENTSKLLRPFNLLPTDTDLFHYFGSLTTPPCSAALWVMCARRMTMSREQIGRLVDAMVDKPNNRPVQPLNGRTILLFPAATPPREVPQDWQLVLQADSLVIAAAALVGLALGVGTCASRSQRQVGKLA